MVKRSGQVFLFEEEETKTDITEEGMKVCIPVVKRHNPIGAIDVRRWELIRYSGKSIKEICDLIKQDKGKQTTLAPDKEGKKNYQREGIGNKRLI